jgi:hypothetical protein
VTPERTRAIVPMAELRELSREVGAVQRLVDQMVDARLLVVPTLEGGKGSTVEIVHESLVQGWPALRRWLDENQDDAALVDQLRTAARQWQAKSRDPGLLWRGETADEAKKFRKRYKGPLSDVERGFLDAVVAYEQAALRRRRAAVIGGFTVLSALVIGAMVVAFFMNRLRTEAKRQEAAAVVNAQEAQRQLEIAQQKERERQEADAKKMEALAQKKEVTKALDVSKEQLAEANAELSVALNEALENEKQAKKEERRAERNEARAKEAEAAAVIAKDEALAAKAEAETAYRKERDRADRLQKQVGTIEVELK